MLKILYKDGSTDEKEGRVKHYAGDYLWDSNYEFAIEGKSGNHVNNLKLVLDTDTNEFIYFGYRSMHFKKIDQYEEYYQKSIKDIELEQKFKDYLEVFIETDNLDVDDIPELLTSFRENILEIYNS